MIYIFSDGSLASDGTIDDSVAGRGKGVWTADNGSVAATYFLVYDPKAKPMPAQSNPEMSLQLGYFNPDGSQNTTCESGRQQRPEPGADDRAQLHGADDSTSAVANWPNLWPAIPTEQYPRFGSGRARPSDHVPAARELVNGKVPG